MPNFFLKTMLFLLLSIKLAFAYNSIEILDNNINVKKASYFATSATLTPAQALSYYKTHTMNLMPHEAQSFNNSHNTYWFIFEIATNKTNSNFLINSGITLGDYQTLYIFNGKTLIKEEKNGFLVPINERCIKTQAIRFNLQDANETLIYALEVKSLNPIYATFAFGTPEELNDNNNINNIMAIVANCVGFAFLIYNFLLYLATRDKAYLFYCVYIFGFCGFDILLLGYMNFFELNTQYFREFLLLFIMIKFSGLAMFAIYFLNLSGNDKKYFLWLIASGIPVGILYILKFQENLGMFWVQAIAMFSIYIGFKKYLSGSKSAMFYIAATCISNVLFILYMTMAQWNILPYTFLSVNLLNIAIIWDLITFSLALSFRIKDLQNKKDLAERMLQARSRFSTLSETIGSIAHQWRQPLTELSLINNYIDAQLRFNGKITKEDLLKSTQESDVIIKRMSSVIEMFYGFFDVNSTNEKFEASQLINNVATFLKGQFETYNIDCTISCNQTYVINGNSDEFFQAILNILTNAKDELVQNKIENPKINISITNEKTNIYIKIQDNAGGIKTESIYTIFEPYYSTKGMNGTGIGLYVTKNIIENKMQGSIIVENTKNGASFTIVLKQAKSI